MDIDARLVADRMQEFIRRQMDEMQRGGVALGMSGGIDCAVVASLQARALGPDRVPALILPERDSDPHSKSDALREIERLGLAYREVDLTPILRPVGVYGALPLGVLGARRFRRTLHEGRAGRPRPA